MGTIEATSYPSPPPYVCAHYTWPQHYEAMPVMSKTVDTKTHPRQSYYYFLL